MCNAGDGANPTALGTSALQTVLGRTMRPAQLAAFSRIPVEMLKQFEGVYVGPTPEQVLRLTARDSVLALVPGTRVLIPIGDARFRAGSTEFSFERKGTRIARVIQMSGADSIIYLPTSSATQTSKSLATYAGVYWSDELDARVSVAALDSLLILRRSPRDSLVLRPTIPDTFESNAGVVQFSRDRAGAVTGLGLWSGRVRDIHFTKQRVK